MSMERTMRRTLKQCVHFNGIQHEKCSAGVAYLSVRDSSQAGPYRWPCLTLAAEKTSTTTCPSFRLKSDEEWAKEDAQFEKAFAAISEGKSPCCGAPLDESHVRDGTGPRFCLKCKQFVFRGCNPSEVP